MKYSNGSRGVAIQERPQHSFLFPAISICGDVSAESVKSLQDDNPSYGWVVSASQTFTMENQNLP